MKITFTGVDHYTNLTQLAEMANQPGIEFGILYSVSQSINRIPRYPSEVFIKALMRDLPGCALHVCGVNTRKQVLTDKYWQSALEDCSRIQLNGYVTEQEVVAFHDAFKVPIVTQYRAYDPARSMLGSCNATQHQLLVDASGGRGISPKDWVRPDTNKLVGFAGGLGPDNIAIELPRIHAAANGHDYWIDMEAKVRSQNDWFNLDRVQDVYNAWRTFIRSIFTFN
jgi:phosphoribosylanthranilate isomerase